MKNKQSYLFNTISFVIGFGIMAFPTDAQVIPDGTLSTTVTSPDNQNFVIDNGDRTGNNLFHSFSEFSVPTNGSAVFNNTDDIETIFGRVTGANISDIDGLIQANGTANLFLLNPNGIMFGAGAELDIGGSFLATTAESILFDRGLSFSSTEPVAAPLLSISAPIGLQFGNRASPIVVEQSNLQVRPGTPFGFLGGDIQLVGSQINAFGGHISLGSVTPKSQIAIDGGLSVDYSNATDFRDITITQNTLVNASGDGGGSLQVQGRTVDVLNSTLDASNFGATDGSLVSIRASERLMVEGNNTTFNSAIYSDAFAEGTGNHLLIEAGQLVLSQSGLITADSYGQGAGGGLTVNAEEIYMIGNPDPTGPATFLVSGTFGPGQGGDLLITADRFTIQGRNFVAADVQDRSGMPGAGEGTGGNLVIDVNSLTIEDLGQVATSTSGSGNAGNMEITVRDLTINSGAQIGTSTRSGTGNAGNMVIIATESIDIAGLEATPEGPSGFAISGLYSSALSRSTGEAGDIYVETPTLSLFDGAQIIASANGAGNAGDITIQTDEIEIAGQSNRTGSTSGIRSISRTDAAAGSITLSSNQVNILDDADVSVSSLGDGDAGDLFLSADTLFLSDGKIQATVNAGAEGNISLSVDSLLLMRQESLITTNATSQATGGNITIQSPVILGLDNSDIVANAVEGNGGAINITTQALLGLEFRGFRTPENDITASSEFGLDGIVQLDTPELEPDQGLVELPSNLAEPSNQIATGCLVAVDNSFTMSGRSGLPDSPELPNSPAIWEDWRPLEIGEKTAAVPIAALSVPFREATDMTIDGNGQVEFVVSRAEGATPTEVNGVVSCGARENA